MPDPYIDPWFAWSLVGLVTVIGGTAICVVLADIFCGDREKK